MLCQTVSACLCDLLATEVGAQVGAQLLAELVWVQFAAAVLVRLLQNGKRLHGTCWACRLAALPCATAAWQRGSRPRLRKPARPPARGQAAGPHLEHPFHLHQRLQINFVFHLGSSL